MVNLLLHQAHRNISPMSKVIVKLGYKEHKGVKVAMLSLPAGHTVFTKSKNNGSWFTVVDFK